MSVNKVFNFRGTLIKQTNNNVFINRTIKFTILYALQIACVPLNSQQDKTLNKGDIKLLEKKGEEKKYNINFNIQNETTDFSLLNNIALNNVFFKIYFLAYFSG